jgi:hypothetical protein
MDAENKWNSLKIKKRFWCLLFSLPGGSGMVMMPIYPIQV